MKIKCNDNIVREFAPSGKKYPMGESYCNECGFEFGVHDTKILKPRWKEHICKDKCHNCGIKRSENLKIIFEGRYNCKNCGHYLGKIPLTILNNGDG